MDALALAGEPSLRAYRRRSPENEDERETDQGEARDPEKARGETVDEDRDDGDERDEARERLGGDLGDEVERVTTRFVDRDLERHLRDGEHVGPEERRDHRPMQIGLDANASTGPRARDVPDRGRRFRPRGSSPPSSPRSRFAGP